MRPSEQRTIFCDLGHDRARADPSSLVRNRIVDRVPRNGNHQSFWCVMKRSAPLQRKTPLQNKTPMRRTGWKSSPTQSTDWRTQLRSGGIKTRNRRPTVAEGSKYLAACKGEPCYLNVLCARCDWADPTVVPCHSNQSKHGKGMLLKARHEFTLPGCGPCHAWLDRGPAPREEKFAAFDRGFERWEPVRARKMGIDVNQLEVVE